MPCRRFSILTLLVPLVCLLVVLLPACSARHSAAPPPSRPLDRVVADVCSKRVVMLGEATHGEGQTFEAKAVLVKRLIEECGFSLVLVESGVYDFIDLRRSLATSSASPEQLSNAVGKIWTSAHESRPWLADLFDKAVAGTVEIGGIDDQISVTAKYAQARLPGQLAAYLDSARPRCETEIRRFTSHEYDDATPYDEATRDRVLGCLAEIRAAIDRRPRTSTADEDRVMAASLARRVERSLDGGPQTFDARDRSMFENFEWHVSRLPADAKIIVWCATIHAAKRLPRPKDGAARTPLGTYIHGAFGERAAAIGFSAYAGSYAMVSQPVSTIPPAPASSLEGRAFASADGGDVRYLDRTQLARLGPIDARPLNYRFARDSWHEIVDGMVVFRIERPPVRVDAP